MEPYQQRMQVQMLQLFFPNLTKRYIRYECKNFEQSYACGARNTLGLIWLDIVINILEEWNTKGKNS